MNLGRCIIQVSKNVLNHPLGRGMLSYSITWPTAAFIQEILDKKTIGEWIMAINVKS